MKTNPLQVDEEDLRLIHALQLVPRISWSNLAGILRTHPSTLANRWERLRSQGLAWVAATNVGPRMASSLAFLDVECHLPARNSVIQTLCRVPEVLTVSEPARNRDIALTVETESMADLGRELIPFITGIEGVTRIQVSLSARLHTAGHVWRLNALDPKEREALESLKPAAVTAQDLSPQDEPIVECLMRDGRASCAEIAKELGVHPTTVSRRLKRILDGGTLSFRCEVSQLDTGFPVTCQWYAHVPLGRHEQAATALRGIQNLRLSSSTTGGTNFTFVMWLRSMEEIMTMGLEVLQRVPEMTLVETSVAVRYSKRMRWLLDDAERATGQVVL